VFLDWVCNLLLPQPLYFEANMLRIGFMYANYWGRRAAKYLVQLLLDVYHDVILPGSDTKKLGRGKFIHSQELAMHDALNANPKAI